MGSFCGLNCRTVGFDTKRRNRARLEAHAAQDGIAQLSPEWPSIEVAIDLSKSITNAFSKKFDNLRHAVALHFMYYNFCRVHQTLKATPAMAAGLESDPWSIERLIGLLDIAAGSRKMSA